MNSNFKGHALIITVNENQDLEINSLGNAVLADGKAIEATLLNEDICGYRQANVLHLSGSNSSLNNIISSIRLLASDIKEEEPFFMYYSGHGGLTPEGVSLIPYDAQKRTLSNLLSSKALSEALETIPSKRKLILVDACHAGGLNLTSTHKNITKALSHEVLNALTGGEGTVVIASSRSSETSTILGNDSLSLFTKHLVAGLQGKGGHDSSGFIKVFDLFNYVAENVRVELPDQTPVYAAYHQDSNFAIAFCKNTSKRVEKPLESRENNLEPFSHVFLDTFCKLYPIGPLDQDILQRAGGNLSQFNTAGSGKTAWQRVIREIDKGCQLQAIDLINEAYEDYPFNKKLKTLRELASSQ